jgi:predicted heme/steroid binding protein
MRVSFHVIIVKIITVKIPGVLLMKIFTRQELSEYNGKNNLPAYIAYKGKVYDVSQSFLWKKGAHQVLHEAGKDLTRELEEAPHGPELLARVPLIGILQN